MADNTIQTLLLAIGTSERRKGWFEKVKEALMDALGVDDDEVTPDATMVGDLGAESIDFLDIVFKLEKAFSFLRERFLSNT